MTNATENLHFIPVIKSYTPVCEYFGGTINQCYHKSRQTFYIRCNTAGHKNLHVGTLTETQP